MSSMLAEDLTQLKQIETKLAELAAQPSAEQARKQALIDALSQSRKELLQYCRGAPSRVSLAA